ACSLQRPCIRPDGSTSMVAEATTPLFGSAQRSFAFLPRYPLSPAPAHEPFDGLVLRQTQLVIDLGRLAVALFRALPELALVGAGEHRPVLLALVLEDRVALAAQFTGAERHRHLDPLRFPL